MSLSRRSLDQILDARLDGRLSESDETIFAKHAAQRTVLVVDLSGFTRLSRARGILFFLAVHRRATRIFTPLVEQFAGSCPKLEADNLIAHFATIQDALDCALSFRSRCQEVNRSLADEASHVRPCMGIETGQVLLLEDDLFGDPVNIAFKLGEDVAKAFEILVGPNAHVLAGLDGERDEVDLGGMKVLFSRLES